MTHEEKVFSMMLSVAPVLVKTGIDTQVRLVEAGADPEKVTIDGMSLVDSYAHIARVWTEAMVKASEGDINL